MKSLMLLPKSNKRKKDTRAECYCCKLKPTTAAHVSAFTSSLPTLHLTMAIGSPIDLPQDHILAARYSVVDERGRDGKERATVGTTAEATPTPSDCHYWPSDNYLLSGCGLRVGLNGWSGLQLGFCPLRRCGARLGWCLSEALGISNAELDGKQLQEITTAFAKAAVPRYSAICALECILQADCTTRPRTPRQRQHYLEQRLLEIEEAAWIEGVVDAVA